LYPLSRIELSGLMKDTHSHKGFKDLECWKQARELRKKISELVKRFPKEEKFMLVSQMIRSSRSITNNICEGYGRFTYVDTRHFFIQARGSVVEMIDHLIIAFDENYIADQELNETETLCDKVTMLINGYIAYLDRQRLPIPNP
jgi:four helix bundle protein